MFWFITKSWFLLDIVSALNGVWSTEEDCELTDDEKSTLRKLRGELLTTYNTVRDNYSSIFYRYDKQAHTRLICRVEAELAKLYFMVLLEERKCE